MIYIVALTGGIGSGKTTVSNGFKKMGIDVIDSDVIAKKIMHTNPIVLSKIHQKFGKSILYKNNLINRTLLRKYIINDKSNKIWLENLLHSRIYQESRYQFKKATSKWCLWVVPLLIEKKLEKYAHRTLLIDMSNKKQIKNVIKRDNIDHIEAQNIINIQTYRSDRRSKADDIIYNNKNIEKLHKSVYYLNIIYTHLAKLNKKNTKKNWITKFF